MSKVAALTEKLNNNANIVSANTAPTFAVGGIVTTDLGGPDLGGSVIVQADGKILLGGTNKHRNFGLVRYNADGSLDLSFDGDGKVTTAFGNYNYVYDDSPVTVQADGKILLGGVFGGDFGLVRYTTDGLLDRSFGGDGKVIADLGYYANDSSVTVQADGKILLGWGTGTNYTWDNNNNFSLVRLNTDGSLDLGFDDDGKVSTDLGGSDRGSSVTVQADGKILVGGTTGSSSLDSNFALVRYNADGSLDLSFDGDGKVTTDLGGSDLGSAVTVQADGKILLGGSSERHSSWVGNFALVRYNTDGSLDSSFGGDGIITSGFGVAGPSVTVQADGKILLGGTASNNNDSVPINYDFGLVRYNSDGSLDSSFSDDGKVTTNLDGVDYGSSVTVQADGKILLGGTSGHSNFSLVRYNSDGSLDSSFNPNPVKTLNKTISYTENGGAVVLDNTVQVYDAELAAQGNYNGASITLARQGGANTEDIFSGSGRLSFSGNVAVLSGLTLGTVSNGNGTLSINFNSDATQERVDAVLSSIAYNNASDYPIVPTDTPSSVKIDWTFNDGNIGVQGIGDALVTTESIIINILANHAYDEVIGTTQNDYLYGRSSANKIYGFAGNDYLNGRGGNDTLDGAVGNDTLDGGYGADSMLGGLGDDLYSVDRVSDVVIENLNEGTDLINTNHSLYVLPANVENLTLIGADSIDGKGNDLANTLIGNNNDNRLSGGAGADSLIGGSGADKFKFNTEAESGITATTRDTIVDFSHAQGDKIDLSAIDANTALADNNAFTEPTVGGSFSGTFVNTGELYFDQSENILYGNNDADSAADFSIKLAGVSRLVAEDFVL